MTVTLVHESTAILVQLTYFAWLPETRTLKNPDSWTWKMPAISQEKFEGQTVLNLDDLKDVQMDIVQIQG